MATESERESKSNEPTPPANQKPNKLSLSLDYRAIIVVLVLVIIGMLIIWKPWSAGQPATNARTVSVTGEATITATPDQFVFNPSYDFKDPQKDVALAALTKQNNDIISKLKALGVADSKIKNQSNGNDYPYFYDDTTKQATYTLSLTITVADKDLAQKVQDYLVTTDPTDQVTPQAEFSDAKQKTLEAQARDKASKDARAKADQSASNLGFKVAGIKSVDDGTSFSGGGGCGRAGFACPLALSSGAAADSKASTSLNLQPGENDLTYSVTVVYYIK